MTAARAGGPIGWEHFPHGSDMGLRGFGPDPDTAFEQAALAMTAAVTDPEDVAARETVGVTCAAPDMEVLLLDWLNAVIFEMDHRKMVFGRFQARISGPDGKGEWRLTAELKGEAVDRSRHQPAVEVKAASLAELKVERDPAGRWIAQCVVDV